jgi:hypothetical protein
MHAKSLLTAAAALAGLLAGPALAAGGALSVSPPPPPPGRLASAVAAAPAEVTIRVLSSRPDLVTGDDALVEVAVPAGVSIGDLTISAGDREVTDAFAPLPDGRFAGLVTGLPLGTSTITATLPGRSGARLTVTNHAITGPLFSGPHLEPFLCSTVEAGLGPPTDEHCSAPPTLRYAYRSRVTGRFHALSDPDQPPPDVATTTTDEGQTLDYVVRVERGVIDRAIYDIAVLYDPAQPDWSPWTSQRGWNGKVLWEFGGNGFPDHRQLLPPDVFDEGQDLASAPRPQNVIGRGYAVAATSFNILGNNLNTVTSAESLAMTKEHLTETYGVPLFTVGLGCSGGSINVHEIAESYPGLLDGILPYCSFPDTWAVAMQLLDCALFERYWDEGSPHLWVDQQDRRAVAGEVSPTVCSAWSEGFRFQYQIFDPSYGCVGSRTVTGYDRGLVPQPEWVYNPETNPDGVRCTLQDYMSNVYGKERPEGWAGRPYDNVGFQYGLQALQDGDISAEQFVDLNARVGGFDLDLVPTGGRSVADPLALRFAYQAGRVVHGSGGLRETAIIDFRPWSPSEVHTDYHSFSMRERMLRANGNADNHVIIRSLGAAYVPQPPLFATVIDQMDRWMTELVADTSSDSRAVKVARARPDDLVDVCYVDLGDGRVSTLDPEQCATTYPYGKSPRNVADAPFTNDVLKCQLRPIDWTEYDVEFTDAQRERLLAAFPDGVCDWTRAGVGQQSAAGTWLTFNDGPGGRVLGPPPESMVVPAGGSGVRAEPAASGKAAAPGGSVGGRSLPATGASTPVVALGVVLLALAAALVRRSLARPGTG